MAKIAFLGLGAMGKLMAKNLILEGNDVTVWNRSQEACKSLVEQGTKLAKSPKDAALNADFVISMVRDNIASANVWLNDDEGAIHGLCENAIAIESSTITPDWSKKLSKAFEEKNLNFIEAPVSGSLIQAESKALIHLVGGSEENFNKSVPVLKNMGSLANHTGPVGSAAVLKLAINSLMGIQVSAIAELIAMMKNQGVDIDKALEAMSQTLVWSGVIRNSSKLMLENKTTPMFPVDLLEKDLNYTLSCVEGDKSLPIVKATQQVFKKAKKEGLQYKNMTSISNLYKN